MIIPDNNMPNIHFIRITITIGFVFLLKKMLCALKLVYSDKRFIKFFFDKKHVFSKENEQKFT